MKTIAIIIFSLFWTGQSQATEKALTVENSAKARVTTKTTARDPQFLTFKEWRQKMIQSAEENIKKIQDEIDGYQFASKQFTATAEKRHAHLRLEDLKLKLEIEKMRRLAAADLSMNDYFIGHLMKPTISPEAALELSERLSQDEVAHLVRAFAEMVRKSRHSNLIQATIPAIEQ